MAHCGFSDDPSKGVSGPDSLVRLGPTLQVDIGFDPSYDPHGTILPAPGVTGVHALVDTGATECCIDVSLATSLNLPIVDRRNVSGIAGSSEVNVYMAQVHFPSLGKTMYGAFSGVSLLAGGQVHSALIGRTFLRHFTMTYDGTTGIVEIV
ncbi:MAG: hypothetical protein JWN34_2862 [Bryobacterales bacterium]|nr:hypothetical protein [Bryobacterales bacterium]